MNREYKPSQETIDRNLQGKGISNRRGIMLSGATAIFLVLSWRGECWAYIDPNAGGFLSQILVPLASIFLSFLFYCRKEIRRLAKSVRDRWKRIDSPGAAPEVRK
ncbi:MAG: hypothetical protein WCE23_17190 [Candidatus Binatus sp.]|uniref:hypothetical protein n=1 Tax=Candidatus Binatus sp. TaxID=2811406 RepID=UPI003C790D4E